MEVSGEMEVERRHHLMTRSTVMSTLVNRSSFHHYYMEIRSIRNFCAFLFVALLIVITSRANLISEMCIYVTKGMITE